MKVNDEKKDTLQPSWFMEVPMEKKNPKLRTFNINTDDLI